MSGFSEDFTHEIEKAFASLDPDPVRDLERKSLSRIRYLACCQAADLEAHLEATGHLALELATALGLSERERENVWYAASLHDIGKLGVNAKILEKKEVLTDFEFTEIRGHTLLGHRILSGLGGEISEVSADVALCHHERWDGTGYPNGIGAEDISLASRIVALADVYDCITSGRPYQPPRARTLAIEELIKCSGSQFDPELVEVFTSKVLPNKES